MPFFNSAEVPPHFFNNISLGFEFFVIKSGKIIFLFVFLTSLQRCFR